jgi:hypothetical protein
MKNDWVALGVVIWCLVLTAWFNLSAPNERYIYMREKFGGLEQDVEKLKNRVDAQEDGIIRLINKVGGY